MPATGFSFWVWEHIERLAAVLLLLFCPVLLVGFLRSEYQVDEGPILEGTENVNVVAHRDLRIFSWSDYRPLANKEYHRAASGKW